MAEATFGQLFHTKDGKTVFIDPKNKQATVFEGVLTIDQIMEPSQNIQASKPGDAIQAISQILGFLPLIAQPTKIAFVLGKKEDEDVDILGPKNHFILVPNDAPLLTHEAVPINVWVSEYKGNLPGSYQDHTKYQIMPEQWDWLLQHDKDCHIKAWYDKDCPAFVALACLDHNKMIRPVVTGAHYSHSVDDPFALIESSEVQAQDYSVTTEEREI